jgi:hypothetical protein
MDTFWDNFSENARSLQRLKASEEDNKTHLQIVTNNEQAMEIVYQFNAAARLPERSSPYPPNIPRNDPMEALVGFDNL